MPSCFRSCRKAATDVAARDLGGPEEPPRLVEIPRQVAVGIEDPLLFRRGEPGPERPSEPAVLLVGKDADPRLGRGSGPGDLAGPVLRPVVHEDDLPIAGVSLERGDRHVEEVADTLLLVVHRDDERDRPTRFHGAEDILNA